MKKWLLTFLIGLCIFGFQQFSEVFASELSEDYFGIATNYFNSKNYQKALEYVEDVLKIEPENSKAQSLKAKILCICIDTQNSNATKPTDVISYAAPGTQPSGDIIIQSPPKSVVEPNVLSSSVPVIVSEKTSTPSFIVLNVPQADTDKMTYNSDYYNTKGQDLYQKKDYDAAIGYFYKAIKLNPRNQQAYNNLAMAYWFKNNTAVAVNYFKKAYSINKNYTQPLVNLALLYKQLGDEKKELWALNEATKHNPNDYCAYYVLGEYYKSKMQYTQAIANYKEVIKINPKYSQVYLSLALCFFETEQFNYTLMALGQYIQYNPTSDFAYFMMARTNLVLCRYSEAKENIVKAMEINHKPEYQYELAKINYYQEDYQVALDIFQTLLQTTNSAEYYNYSGLCNYKLKNIDAAISNFNKAIEIDGLRPIYYYNLAQCYKSIGDKKNYAKSVNMATKITPINFQDFIDLSYIYYDNGNPNYAINMLNNAISKYPSVKALYLSKLKIYESLGDNLHYNEIKDLINERFNTK